MSLNANEASIAIGMIARGDKQHDVAAWFGVNQARIAEACEGKFGTTSAAPADQLPPQGAPGLMGRRLKEFADNALASLSENDPEKAISLLQEGIASYTQDA